MLRKIQPKREFSPRLKNSVSKAAHPFEFNDIESVLRKAGVWSAIDLTPHCGGSWLDILTSLEVSIGRKLTTFEAGVLKGAIDAVGASSKERPPKRRLVDNPAPGQSGSTSAVTKNAPFFESKFTAQQYEDAEASILQVAEAFANQSDFIRDARVAKQSPEKCRRILSAAMKATIKSPKTVITYSKHVMAFYEFLELNEVPDEQRSGKAMAFHLFEFLEQKAGTTVPATIKCALKTFADVLNIDWPLDHKSIIRLCEKPDKDPKTAPLLEADHVKYFEQYASDKSKELGLRIYAATFALMCHGSLRYDDTTSIENFTVEKNSIIGRISQPKVRSRDAKKFFCPSSGLTDTDWASPIIDFRKQYSERRGYEPSYLFPDLSAGSKQILESKAKKYHVVKVFRELLKQAGVLDPSKYTLHSPRNWYVTVAAQLGWGRKAQTTLGRWGNRSVMPDHYNRQKGTIELAIRNDVVSRIKDSGWTPSTGLGIPGKPPRAKHYLRHDEGHLEPRE